ncbi:MAG: hypothetical protein ACXWDU_01410 [Actinomycetota bacterium]
MRRTLAAALALVAVSCSIATGAAPSQPPAQSPPALGTAGCPVAGELAPPRTLMLFRDDGCVPPERLLGFRCSPDEPVVIEVGAGTRRAERFIGERWATPSDALPTDAFPLGDGGDMQVFGVPGDEKTLYVARDDTVERWLRLPRLGASDPPTAFVIGDSIADGAEPSIIEALPGWSIGFDAVIGRGTNSALAVAAAQAAVRPDVVVIELGTNDADPVAFRENGAAMLDALTHVPLVVWQTAHGPLENIPGVNIHIHGLVSQHPNAVVAAWDTFVSDDELSSDGVHPAPGHEDLMAALIAPILTGWLEVANGGGASSCASQAEAAAGVG